MSEIPGYRGTSHLLEDTGELAIAGALWNRRSLTFLLNCMPTAISHLTDFCSGRLKQRTLLLIFIPLILVAYFGILTLAIWMFPAPFDWRTRSMSKLLYPRNNPQFHAIGSVG